MGLKRIEYIELPAINMIDKHLAFTTCLHIMK